jgi:membrane protease YdiL (CAAX protease family)
LFWGGGVGVIYGLIFWLVGMSFGRRIDLNMLGVSGVSAVTENLVFVGFLLPVFQDKYGKNRAMLLTAILFGLIHLPIAWFDYKLQGMMVFYLFLMTVILGYINSWLRLRTGNVGSAMLSSWIWSMLVLS